MNTDHTTTPTDTDHVAVPMIATATELATTAAASGLEQALQTLTDRKSLFTAELKALRSIERSFAKAINDLPAESGFTTRTDLDEILAQIVNAVQHRVTDEAAVEAAIAGLMTIARVEPVKPAAVSRPDGRHYTGTVAERIVMIMTDFPDLTWSNKNLTSSLGVGNRNQVGNATGSLAKAGTLVAMSPGRYRLATTNVDTSDTPLDV